MNAQLIVDDRHRVMPHLGGAAQVMPACARGAYPIIDLVVAGDARTGSYLVTAKQVEGLLRGYAAHLLEREPGGDEIVFGRQIARVDRWRVHGVARPQPYESPALRPV